MTGCASFNWANIYTGEAAGLGGGGAPSRQGLGQHRSHSDPALQPLPAPALQPLPAFTCGGEARCRA